MSQPTHSEPGQPPPDNARPSRLAWWLHPKVALPLTLFVLILLGPLLYRNYRISSVPDIGDPFDVAAFEAVEIPATDNAAEIYVATDAMLVRGKYPTEDLDRVFENGWSDATEELQKLLTANERALDEWRRGTERPTVQFVSPKEISIHSILPSVYELREFSRLTRLRAERCLHEGDIVEAWDWLRAGVRASRQLGQHGGFVERLVGIYTFSLVAQGINRWAADPRVDESFLRKAAEQFDADDAMTPLTSVGFKSEYVCYLHMIESDPSLTNLGAMITDNGVPASALPVFMFVMGEPEYSRLLVQHVFDGWLEHVDLPKWKRASKATVSLGMYPPVPKPGQLSGPKLGSRLDSIRLARARLSQHEEHVDREAAHRAALKLTLAVQRHYRLHGDWPGKLEDLAPDILKELPADPFGKSGETLLLKRDGDDLIIYSLGNNGFDDSGAIIPAGASPLDEGFRLKRPRSPSADK